MYVITGYILTHGNLVPAKEEKQLTEEFPITIPVGMLSDRLPAYIQKEFGLRGQRGKCEPAKTGEISIFYIRPKVSYQVIISADKKMVKIITTELNLRRNFIRFHRVMRYGGGFVYDLYVIMTDLTGISILVFSITGIWLGLNNRKMLIAKLLVLSLTMGYTLLVIFSLMKS